MTRTQAVSVESTPHTRDLRQAGGWSIVDSGRNANTPLADGDNNAVTGPKDTLVLSSIVLGEDPDQFKHGAGSRRAREIASLPLGRHSPIPVSGEVPLYVPREESPILSYRNEGIDALEHAYDRQMHAGMRRELNSDLGDVPWSPYLEAFSEAPTYILPTWSVLWAASNWRTKEGLQKRLKAVLLWVKDELREEVEVWRNEFHMWGRVTKAVVGYVSSSLRDGLGYFLPSLRQDRLLSAEETEHEPTHTFIGNELLGNPPSHQD